VVGGVGVRGGWFRVPGAGIGVVAVERSAGVGQVLLVTPSESLICARVAVGQITKPLVFINDPVIIYCRTHLVLPLVLVPGSGGVRGS